MHSPWIWLRASASQVLRSSRTAYASEEAEFLHQITDLLFLTFEKGFELVTRTEDVDQPQARPNFLPFGCFHHRGQHVLIRGELLFRQAWGCKETPPVDKLRVDTLFCKGRCILERGHPFWQSRQEYEPRPVLPGRPLQKNL